MAQPQVPLINGIRYSWADLKVQMLGRLITGFTAINFKRSRVKENNYGGGSEPDHRGYGNREYEASITLYDYEVQALVAALGPDKDLTDIGPFSITVMFLNEAGQMQTRILQNCEFLEDSMDLKQGDTKVERVCPLIIAGIKKA